MIAGKRDEVGPAPVFSQSSALGVGRTASFLRVPKYGRRLSETNAAFAPHSFLFSPTLLARGYGNCGFPSRHEVKWLIPAPLGWDTSECLGMWSVQSRCKSFRNEVLSDPSGFGNPLRRT